MKRQRNRGRGGGGGGGGNGKPQHNANRAFDSNGPDGVKVRGAAQHIYEKYQQLARDTSALGDRVLAENYLQHAEHYFRVLRAMQPQRPVTEIIGRDQFASGYDIDFEDESQNVEEPAEAEVETAGDGRQGQWQRDDRQPREERPQNDYRQQGEYRQQGDRGQGEYRQRDDRPQGEYRQRDDRYQGERRERFQRDDRPRDDRPRDDRPRDDRPRDDRPREDRQGGGRYQGDRPQRQDRDYRSERGDRDPLTVIEPQATPLTAQATAPAAYEPPREGPSGVLRGEDGTTSHAPAFLQPRAEPRPEAAEDEPAEPRRPRRRRAPRTFEAGEAAAPAEADEG
ncbi:MAG TPA: DUF4167 domain-containing protein [Caulobacteraceae bacterium]